MSSPTVDDVLGRVPAGPTTAAKSSRERIDSIAWLLVVATAGLAVAWARTSHLLEASALFGFEPSALIHPVWERPEFAADFPNGEAEALRSLVGQIYRLLGFLALSPRTIVAVMIFAEFCTLATGAFLCTRAIDRRQPAWLGLGAALLVTTSALLNCDIASWGYPYYGSVYNFAYGTGLAGFAAILSRRPILAGLAVAITISIHPIIGIFFALAVGVAALIRFKNYSLSNLVLGGLLAFVLAGGWLYLMFDGASISGEAVDANLYIGLTRMMSWHWFPITLGVFTTQSGQALLPFTAMMLLLASLIGRGDQERNAADRQIGAAIVVLILVTLIGVLTSEYSRSPLLAKMALHRASAEVLLLSAMVVVPRLLCEATSGTALRAGLAALLLLMPFWRSNGLPILLCMLFVLVVVFEERKQRSQPQMMLPMGVVCFAAVILAGLYGSGIMPMLFSESNLSTGLFSYPLFIAAFGLAVLSRTLKLPVLLAAAFLISSQTWIPQVGRISDAGMLAQARAFLDVQEWARSNTAPDALFMTDPGNSYGWREHSQRPSFGTAREWLYSSWVYDTRPSVMQEGLHRAEALGLDVKAYLEAQKLKPGNATSLIQHEASRLYHSKEATWFQAMARQFGVEYFVLDKTKGKIPIGMQLVYENENFIVIQPTL